MGTADRWWVVPNGVRRRAGGLALAMAVLALLAAGPISDAHAATRNGVAYVGGSKATKRPVCSRHIGHGWAPTEHFARLKAWEVVAQATGNWPIQSDEFRGVHYQCRGDRGGRSCRISIRVCQPG